MNKDKHYSPIIYEVDYKNNVIVMEYLKNFKTLKDFIGESY